MQRQWRYILSLPGKPSKSSQVWPKVLKPAFQSLPCVFAERNKGYQIGETFFIKDYGESHTDFSVSEWSMIYG